MAETQNKGGALAQYMSGAGVPAKKDEIAAALLQSARGGQTGGGGDVDYLTFSGQGANYRGWTVGRDKSPIDPEDLYILEPLSAVEGWTCWKNGGVAEKHEWSPFAKENAIPFEMLADHGTDDTDGDGWVSMRGIGMVNADDPSRMIKFTTTATSAKNALADLMTELATRLINDEPDIPVIRLSSETFVARGKTNGKPKFEVDTWVTRGEVEAFLSMDEPDVDALLEGRLAPEEEQEEAEAEPEEPPKRARRARRTAAA